MSIAWVSDVGTSSTWWVTTTSGGAPASVGEVVEGLDELLTSGEVEPRGRFVQQHDGRLVHQRPGEQDAAALARRQCDQGMLGEAADPHPFEALRGPLVVACRVAVPPRLEGAVPSGAHGVERRECWPQLVG